MENSVESNGTEVRTDTVVIGAGASGLAVGACLRREGVPFILLEKSEQVGSAWHNHYDRLRLHTNKGTSNLPFFPFPSDYPTYPSRDQFARYLEMYADHFDLRPHFGQSVTSVSRGDGKWEIRTQEELYQADNVAVATGFTCVPHEPSWPGQDRFVGPIVHSSQYKNGKPFEGKHVLVVGFGNSGGEIGIDLFEHGATARIVVRSPVNVIPRDVLGLPLVAVASLLPKLPAWLTDVLISPIRYLMYGDIHRYGLHSLPYGPVTEMEKAQRIPLIDVGTIDLIRQGRVEVRPDIKEVKEEEIIFANGLEEAYDAVILATGYHPRVDSFLQMDNGVLDRRGCPKVSGREVAPGLFFCGFRVAPTGMLREINLEARRIAHTVQKKYA